MRKRLTNSRCIMHIAQPNVHTTNASPSASARECQIRQCYKCIQTPSIHLLPRIPLGHKIRIQWRKIDHLLPCPSRIGMPHKSGFPARPPPETRTLHLALRWLRRGNQWIRICRVGDSESAGRDWRRGRRGKFRGGWIRGEIRSACGRGCCCGDGIRFRLSFFAFRSWSAGASLRVPPSTGERCRA